MKVALACRRHESKPHTVQRELRLASSNFRLSIDCIAYDAQTIFLQRLSQLHTIRIVDIDYRVTRPCAQPAIKQSLFRVPVILHRLVIVEMIAREVGED